MPRRAAATTPSYYYLCLFLLFGMTSSDAFSSSSSAAAVAAASKTSSALTVAAAAAADDDTAADIITAAAAAGGGGHCSIDSNNDMTKKKNSVKSVIGTVADDTADVAPAASDLAAAAAAAAAQQQQQRRMYIAQLIVHFRNALEKLGVAINDNYDNDNDSDSDDDDDRKSRSSSHSNASDDNDEDGDDDDGDHDNVLRRIKSMSSLIHESMSISSRNFHSVQHALDVVHGLKNDINNDDNTDNDNHHNSSSDDLNDPIAILAALFHDCVYYHVDGGLSELQLKKLKGAVTCSSPTTSNNAIICQAHTSSSTSCEHDDDDLLCMVEYIFGYEHCQSLTHATGLNEFLSAMIAVRELEPLLSRKQLAQIACCIEMTIPFRPNTTITTTTTTPQGDDDSDDETAITVTTTTTPADRLYANMVQANDKFDLNMTLDEIVQSVQRACILAHSDLSNFGTHDVLWFLDNTWSLLPEANEALRHQYLYTVQQFQFAVFKMHGFFSFLSPDLIFPSFRGVPSFHVMHVKCENAKRNLQVGRRYVGAKLLSISILSAIAELTGGDAPISLFMGDLPSRHAAAAGTAAATGGTSSPTPTKRRLGDGLGLPPAAELLHHHHRRDDNAGDGSNHHGVNGDNNVNVNGNDVAFIDTDVYNLLAFGRRSETDFDIRQSPLAAYLYGSLGNAGLDNILNKKSNGGSSATTSTLWPMSESAAWNLLQKLPLETVLTPIAENMCQVAVSRCEKIRTVLSKLKQRQQEQQQQQQQSDGK